MSTAQLEPRNDTIAPAEGKGGAITRILSNHVLGRQISTDTSFTPAELVNKLVTISQLLASSGSTKLRFDLTSGLDAVPTIWLSEKVSLLSAAYRSASLENVNKLLDLYEAYLEQDNAAFHEQDIVQLTQSLANAETNSWVQQCVSDFTKTKIILIKQKMAEKLVTAKVLNELKNSGIELSNDVLNELACCLLEKPRPNWDEDRSGIRAQLLAAVQRIGTQAQALAQENPKAVHVLNCLERTLQGGDNAQQIMGRIKTKFEDEGVPEDIARQLALGFENNWAGFTSTDASGKAKQIHGIKGLKVYRDSASGELVADFGLRTLASGGYKRVKQGLRILPNGNIVDIVRYTRKEKTKSTAFQKDVQRELGARHLLTGVPNVLEMKRVVYKNAAGVEKERFIAPKCDMTLTQTTLNSDTLQVLPIDNRNPLLFVQGFKDALLALEAVHEKRLVHLDFKPDNILIVGGRGQLADYGLCANSGTAQTTRGSSGFVAPEFFRSKKVPVTTAMDMFSVGMSLLELTNPARYMRLGALQADMFENGISAEKLEAYNRELEAARQALHQQQTPLARLTRALLDPNPDNRPDAAATRKWFDSIFPD